MRLTLVRHATLVVETAGRRLMVDPMLDAAGARGPVRGTPDERPNPLVELPMPAAEATAGIEAVLLTHTHVDHLDAAGVTAVPAGIPWFCQPEDAGDLQPIGLQIQPVPAGDAVAWEGLAISRTGGRHGRTEEVVRGLAPVSGFVVAADGEPTLYVAGDTVWCEEVAEAIAAHDPDVIVVNAGAATFLNGGTVTMEAADVVAVAAAAPRARVVAVHMEAINHCVETRAALAAAVADAGVGDRVLIPSDGDVLAV
ncbi:MAG TPA: MBL fold metallo-hydrolase [Miltoncostaeaceae bacterium]|nr:MBL fold metallo-hydrolase [Miltoncostaeaceae bacterium]